MVQQGLDLVLECHEAPERELTGTGRVTALSEGDERCSQRHCALGRFVTVVLEQRTQDGDTALFDDQALDLCHRPSREFLCVTEDE